MASIATADVAVWPRGVCIEIKTLGCAAPREQLYLEKMAIATRAGQTAALIRYNGVAVAATRGHVCQPTYAVSPENLVGVRRWPMDEGRALVVVPGIAEEMARKEHQGCLARPAPR